MARVETVIRLLVSREEAELLRSFMQSVIENLPAESINPGYEDWSWEKQKAVLKDIYQQLPEAV